MVDAVFGAIFVAEMRVTVGVEARLWVNYQILSEPVGVTRANL